MAERYLSTSEMLNYLANRHGVRRSHDWAHKAAKGRLAPDDYEGPYRRYSPHSVDAYVARTIRSKQLSEGIPMNRDLTTKKFHSGGKAGAEDTEKRRNVEYGRGGKNRD